MKKLAMKRVSVPALNDRLHFEFADGHHVWGTVTSVVPAREGDTGCLVTWRTRSGISRNFNPTLTYRAHAFYRKS